MVFFSLSSKTEIAEIILILMGLFLIIDSLFLHLITFDYSAIGLEFMDPWFDHWMIGALFVIIGGIGLIRTRH